VRKKIKVTRHFIRAARLDRASRIYSCPIAKAINHILRPSCRSVVSETHFRIEGNGIAAANVKHHLSLRARRFIAHFDSKMDDPRHDGKRAPKKAMDVP
jgi:hypothetical protein